MTFKTFNAATKIVASYVPCTLYRVQGYFKHTADAWLQIHDSAGEPDAGAVPLKTYALPYAAPFHWGFEAAALTMTKGCYIAVSSTEGTYTTIAYAENVTYADIEGDYAPYSLVPPLYSETTLNLAFSGAIWADATVGHLYYLKFVNGEGSAMYLHIYTFAAYTNGDVPVASFGPVAAGATLELFFGATGISPYNKHSDGTEHTGCYVAQSAQAALYDNSLDNVGSTFVARSTTV